MTDDTSPSTPMPSGPTRADVFDQYMPIVLFLLFNSVAGLVWAIGAMTLWAVKAQVSRYRRGLPFGRVMPIIVLYLLVRGTLGIIYDSEEVYFGIGIGVKALAAVALVVSVAMGRSAMGYAFSFLVSVDRSVKAHPEYRAAMSRVTLGVALVVFASVGFDTWLIRHASINEFVLIRLGVNWGASIATLLSIGLYLDRRLRRTPDFPGLLPLMERRLGSLGINPPPSSEG
ncbi:MAG: hypothetical protein OXN95_11775 [bacterium]|nr:hypothetical protein [bacterium]